jgi:hypothetical protein
VYIYRTARKHGVSDAAILHALSNAITVIDLEPDADPPNATHVLRPTPVPRGGHTVTDQNVHRTDSGRTLSGSDLERLATEAEETDYDVEDLKTRRRGRPPMGSGPADVVPVRIDPELKAAIEARAKIDNTSTSEVIREAIRRFLDVA